MTRDRGWCAEAVAGLGGVAFSSEKCDLHTSIVKLRLYTSMVYSLLVDRGWEWALARTPKHIGSSECAIGVHPTEPLSRSCLGGSSLGGLLPHVLPVRLDWVTMGKSFRFMRCSRQCDCDSYNITLPLSLSLTVYSLPFRRLSATATLTSPACWTLRARPSGRPGTASRVSDSRPPPVGILESLDLSACWCVASDV